MKHISTVLAVLALSAFAAIGCGKKDGGGNPAVVTTPITCQSGQLYSGQYNACLVASNQCGAGQGWYSGTNSCVPGTPYTGYNTVPGAYPGYPGGVVPGTGGWIGQMIVTNRGAYQDMLRYSGMCSRYTINFGSERCKYYSQGGMAQLVVQGNGAQIAIASNGGGGGYYGGFAPAAYGALTFSGQLVNNGSLLQFQSWNGLTAYISTPSLSPNMLMQLYYNGERFADVNLIQRQ